jgi:hypothetical protein
MTSAACVREWVAKTIATKTINNTMLFFISYLLWYKSYRFVISRIINEVWRISSEKILISLPPPILPVSYHARFKACE